METDERVKKGASEAVNKYGMLMSNSRSFFSSSLYRELEELIAGIMPGYQVISPTTTLSHCANLPALISKDDVIIIDMHAHNSIQMAAKLCMANGTEVVYLREHNDMKKLEEIVNLPQYTGKRTWFLGDGIYSMQGEFLDLENLKKVLDRNPALYAYIDDAHGFGWTGKKGAGYVLGDGTIHSRIITTVSMCKSFGVFGGITVFPNEELSTRMSYAGQTQIFSAPLPSPVLGAAIASAKIHLSGELEIYQNELNDKIEFFKKRCLEASIPLTTRSHTPIKFIEIGNSEETYAVTSRLFNQGIYCSTAAYPSMPKNAGGIRISITRHLEYDDIDFLIEHLAQVL
ncbi:MAG: aminotransferase class I/II-fold pyridoxal phosphate-dependent enzyme [bacterium]|nr:aminotransferase class I/II-fold pyridoxal phosphate-dependent enzyme [bacterium]